MSKDDLGVDYQRAGQVRQLLAERANAETLGLAERLVAVDKQLRSLGYREPEKAPKVVRDEPPVGRAGRHERLEKAEAKTEPAGPRPSPRKQQG